MANPKDKERYLELKEKYYREFLIKINKSNNNNLTFPNSSFPPYKYYIGRGNNSILVRAALKTRFWWSMGDFDDWSDYNFLWTQWKSNKILAQIKPIKEIQADGRDCHDFPHRWDKNPARIPTTCPSVVFPGVPYRGPGRRARKTTCCGTRSCYKMA